MTIFVIIKFLLFRGILPLQTVGHILHIQSALREMFYQVPLHIATKQNKD